MDESKKGYLPMSYDINLSKNMCSKTNDKKERMSRIPYALAIRSIMYVMLCTKLDVSYTLSMASRYKANPSERHWMAVKTILNYLRTKDMFLVYSGVQLKVEGYCDASFQTEKDGSKS